MPIRYKTLLLAILLIQASTGLSQITLPKLMGNGAVLQRGVELKIWGWASAQERIEVRLGNDRYQTQADAQGHWHLMLPPQGAGGPYELVFQGKNTIRLQNILFGDVWVCSGQSNMELTMQRVKDTYPDDLKNATNGHIRQFLVPDQYDFNKTHVDFEVGQWMEASPDNIFQFSAVAYFFAKVVYEKYRVPIGLINAALGGSPVEAWMSEAALKPFPAAYGELQQFKDTVLQQTIQKRDEQRQQQWYRQLNQKDLGLAPSAPWYSETLQDSDWPSMDLPGFWANQSMGAVNGAIWFRKKILVPNSMAGPAAKLWLGRIVDQDSVYVNGRFVGTTGYQYPPRKYTVEPGILKAGLNTLAIRVINQQDKGGFIKDKPYFLAVENDTLDLKGPWQYRLGAEMPPLESPTFIRWKAGGLYNKMIAPLLSYHIKGVIWYQGESNTKDPNPYFETFPALIRDWRHQWQLGDFPFLYVQLANYLEETDQPTESSWATLRQAQLNTLSEPNTGMAVAIDLGEWNDIHPLNKKEVGRRLALQAYKLAYGDNNTLASSPSPKSHKFYKQKVEIRFKDTGKGLVAKNGAPLAYFELSSDGKQFVKARASLKGNKVIVWQEGVDRPKAVRYAWANNPQKANLYGKSGLPVGPFELREQE